jgi:ribosomal-protein-alanine N-acetyltransferase
MFRAKFREDRSPTLIGRRVVLRPLGETDFPQWCEVRSRCRDWLGRWEPLPAPYAGDINVDPVAFALRCRQRAQEVTSGTGVGFGVFVDGYFRGEVNLNLIHRGPFQSAYLGYWIDESVAGLGLIPEAVALVLQYAFEQLALHRVQISIIPRNAASIRVVQKLGLRSEGVALRYLEINGVWEDHERFAITAEEWMERGEWLVTTFCH